MTSAKTMEEAPQNNSQGTKGSTTSKVIPALLLFGAIAFLSVTGGLCLSGTINLAGRTTSLQDFGQRLEFTGKYLTLGVLWLVALIFVVIGQRARTGAINPLGGMEMHLKKQANILQNSLEQFVISAFAQICLISFIDERYTFRTIPWVNFVFFIGRICYLLGYPNYRTFGIFCSLIPSVGMVGVCVYKFCEHLFA